MPVGENKVLITFAAEKEVLEEIKELQKETDTFSRSEVIRVLVDIGLKKMKKKK